MLQGLSLSMLFSAFFGGLVILDACFSHRLLTDPERTVRDATGVTMGMFWPCALVIYLARVHKSGAQCRFEQEVQNVEEERVDRVHRLLQGKREPR